MKIVNSYGIILVFCYFGDNICYSQNLKQTCTTFHNNTGECVDSQLCPRIQAIINNKTKKQPEALYVAKSFCGEKFKIVDGIQRYKVCCEIDDVNNGCRTPKSKHGVYKLLSDGVIPSKDKIPWEGVLVLECPEKFVPKPINNIVCRGNGTWNKQIECIEICPILEISPTVDSRCFQGGNQISCDDLMLNGTIVHFTCKTGHIPENDSEIQNVTCLDGTWSFAVPKCVNITSLALEKLESSYESACKNDSSCLKQFLNIILQKKNKLIQKLHSNASKTEHGIAKQAIVVLGGFRKNQKVDSIETYSTDNNTWIERHVELERVRFFCVFYERKVLLIGGYYNFGNASNIVNSVDLKTFGKTSFAPMNEKRGDLAAVVVGKDIYAIGRMGDDLVLHESMERYDPITDEWKLMEDMPTARVKHGAVAINGEIFVVGGRISFSSPINLNECYTVSTGKWSTRQPMLEKRSDFAIAAIDEFIYVVGGYDGPLASVERYDSKKDKWVYIKSLSEPRTNPVAVNFNGNLVITGGADLDSNSLTQVEQYDKDDWNVLPSLKESRSLHQMIVIPHDIL